MWRSVVLRAVIVAAAASAAIACGRLGFDPRSGTGSGSDDDDDDGAGGGSGMRITAPRAVTLAPDATCAVLDDRSLWCWGWGLAALGVDPMQQIAAPTQIGSDTDWAAAALDVQRLCAVKTSGTLWCNDFGNVTPLRQVGTATDWTAVSADQSVACALRGAGEAWCLGTGLDGQLGNGQVTLVTFDPVAVATPQRFTRLATSSHSCAIDTAGALWCWGRNGNGEVGDGTTTNALSPVHIGSAHWRAVSVSDGRSYGVQADGTLWAWGKDLTNQPLQIGAMTGWTEVANADTGACALRGDELWCTGDNIQGELGTGDTRPRAALTQIDPGSQFAQIAMSDRHTCAVRDGALACTGNGARGELGDGVARWSAAPRALATGPWGQLALGYRSACAIATDASLWCWGSNQSSGLAQPGDHGDASAPLQIGAGASWAQVAVGNLGVANASPFAFARRSDGTLWGWGIFGTTVNASPVQVGTAAWQGIDVGLGHACGLQAGGTLWCWGFNDLGQLGNGSLNAAAAPVQIGTAIYQLVAAGADTSYAIRGDGALFAWGYDGDGELGDNAQLTNVSAPVRVANNTTWTQIAGGARHACGIQTNGGLYCWGDNSSGQLGDGTVTRRPTPVRIGAATNWSRIAAGTAHTCATDTTGGLYCWGDNSFGQLGDGSYKSQRAPVRIADGTSWGDVAATSNYGLGELDGTTCARDAAGTAWCWGDNTSGLLGGGAAWSIRFRPAVR